MRKKIFQALLFSLNNERGLVNVLVALSIVVLLGFTALVVDVGAIYLEKSRLQKALDAAVLGGAQQLVESQEKAKETAKDLASKNGYTIADTEMKTETNTIEIEKTVKKEMIFARILGVDETNIYAIARAELTSGTIVRARVIPVGLEDVDYIKDARYVLYDTPGNGNSVNYVFLAIDGKGADKLREGIKNGSEVEINHTIVIQPGTIMGPVKEGFNDRIDQDKTKAHCNIYESADNTCSRYIIVPLVDSIKNKSSEVVVIGFAAFWIEGVNSNDNDNQITWRFIDNLTSGTSKVKLVK